MPKQPTVIARPHEWRSRVTPAALRSAPRLAASRALFTRLSSIILFLTLGTAVRAPQALADGATLDPADESTESAMLQQVVVTAEKYKERLEDVPMSLTAITGDQLVNSQAFNLQDFLGKVPGLTMLGGADGTDGQLIIRGITIGSGQVNETVATYIDETPYTVVGPWLYSSTFTPNIDTFDMQRIEVLRGPQGTLYGANALGGIVKYVTNPPDPTHFTVDVAMGGSTVNNGGSGYESHGMVNLPLSSDAALRLVGYDTYYPGFIADPARGLAGLNGTHVSGGRASLLFKPSAKLSIRFNALVQEVSARNPPNEDVAPGALDPIFGSLVEENAIVDQSSKSQNALYNITINGDLGFATLVSASSYARAPARSIVDFSSAYGGFATAVLGAPYGVADLIQPANTFHAFTQELRLSSPSGQRFTWLAGAFFTDQRGEDNEHLLPVDLTTNTILFGFPQNLGVVILPVTYREYAGFVTLDYHFTSEFDASLGGRYGRNDQTYTEDDFGLFFGGQVPVFSQSSSQGVTTYSGDLRWHMTSKVMVYARIAKGFVPGGPNDVTPLAPASHSYSASTTTNYEVGTKGTFLEGRLGIDVSAFLINWYDIQLLTSINGLNEIVNGGTARSEGAEWNVSYILTPGLTVNVNGAYTDAYLTQATPASASGNVGDRLPIVPLWGLSAGADYERPLFGGYSGIAGVDWRYVGSRYSEFAAVGQRQIMPSYNIVDLRAGVSKDNWSATLYVKNVGNSVAIGDVTGETLQGLAGPALAASIVYPTRTIGGQVTVNFQ